MARLPSPGSDDGTWGDVLNDFLSVAHEADGTLKSNGTLATKADDTAVVHNAGSETVAGVKTFSSSPIVPTPVNGTEAANKTYVDGAVPSSLVTTKGDTLAATGPGALARVGVGANGQVLTADSSQSAGVKWSPAATLSVSPYLMWNTGDQICVPISSAVASATLSPTSGQSYLTGGPGMIVTAGTEVQGISYVSNAAATGLTHQFAFIAIPDESGLAQATVVAVSADLLTAAWTVNTAKKFSFRAVDGGSGYWTPSVDTPVYGGIVQVGTTPATLRSVTSSGQVGALMTPKWFATASGGLTTPASLASVLALNDSATVPFCRLSRTYN